MQPTFISNILDFIFPKTCLGCRRYGNYLCSKCASKQLQKELICPMCTRPAFGGATHPICQRPHGLDGLWSLGAYHGALRRAILKFKYRFISELVTDLSGLIIEYWVKYPPLLIDQIKQQGSGAYLLVPVPLHPRRLNQRGFNQSELLARSLSVRLGLNYAEALKRVKNTRPQVGLEGDARRTNLRGAFDLNNVDLIGRNVILIDDVWTTGSTIRECAKVLKAAGARSVWGLTIAR